MITIDMTKAKEIAHQRRRDARDKEFKPHDEIIMKQIPGVDPAQAELARQAIREKYADLQTQIDDVSNAEELKQITPQVTI